jgi:formylmethanofuran:tetrahydromethanopterin formyltransferase
MQTAPRIAAVGVVGQKVKALKLERVLKKMALSQSSKFAPHVKAHLPEQNVPQKIIGIEIVVELVIGNDVTAMSVHHAISHVAAEQLSPNKNF